MVTLARTSTEAYRVCNPDQPLPAGDPRWVDLSAGRGDDPTGTLELHLRNKRVGEAVKLVFAGHRGAGKTTELNRLCQSVAPRFPSLYIAANLDMDEHLIEAEDLFLVLAEAVERHTREAGSPLPDLLLDRVHAWFRDVIDTTTWGRTWSADLAGGVSAVAGVPLLGKLLGSLKALLRVESQHRVEIKEKLRKYPGALLDSVNALLDAVSASLTVHRQELLVVVDALDRYPPDVIDRLLTQASDRLHRLRCNLILTPPINLLYQPRTEALDQRFPCEVLPTVRLRRPEQPFHAFDDGPGRDLLLKMLAARIDLDAVLPDAAVRDRVIAASGGAVRELMRFVSEAGLRARGDAIDAATIETVLRRRRARLRDMINANGWLPALVRIRETNQVSRDPDDLLVLYHRLAFKYDGEGWYDIHPLAAELPEIRNATALDLGT